MTTPGMIILYVDHPQNSVAFYQRLLSQAPVEQSATFALFVLNNGFKLGMWSRQGGRTGGDGRRRRRGNLLYVRAAAAGGCAL